jgi:hypothetical protein
MRNVRMLRPEPNLVSIPVEQAIYCENCEMVTNSHRERCGRCGSGRVLRLAALIDGPPSGPESGPALVGCTAPALQLEVTKAA